MQTEEFVTKANAEKTSLDRSLLRLEEENVELRQHVETLQAQLIQVDKDYSDRSRSITHCLLFYAFNPFIGTEMTAITDRYIIFVYYRAVFVRFSLGGQSFDWRLATIAGMGVAKLVPWNSLLN